MAKITATRNLFVLVFAIAMGLGIILAYWFSAKLSATLSQLANTLSQGANRVAKSSSEIADSSTKLSELTTEQAAAIQETAASVDEISAMVSKNSDNATRSQSTSKESRSMADSGSNSVERVITAISDISAANDRIMNQVLEGNKKIEQIVQVISEISTKTKVINDIVFQTKLLSFNASVEAARAGEHGKGFAVVAEEVGNLAQMSGNAAKEISDLLDESFKKVEAIVEETQSSVSKLVEEGRRQVEIGKNIAEECKVGLETIKGKVTDVDSMIEEIAVASREQSVGVSEINQAMNNFDQTTQKNTVIAASAAKSAEELNKQSTSLKGMVDDLMHIIYGSTTKQITSANNTSAKVTVNRNEPITPANVTPIRSTGRDVVIKKDHSAAPDKSVAGEIQIPSKDDPRFEEL
jgi:methyl-accepting chemotaxis protein